MKYIPVILLGAGGVGQTLLRQLMETKQTVLARTNLVFEVVAIADSKSWVWNEHGLSDEDILAAIEAKKSGQPLGPDERPTNVGILDHMESKWIARAIVVDTTAAEGTEAVIDRALDMGYYFATANKKAMAGSWATAQKYYNHPWVRYEATVGAGLPLISTLRYLQDTGDRVRRIEGQLSGTLGYMCALLDDDVSFSQALAKAKAKNYTEPDPRDDLSGMDVMRKVLILARLAGQEIEANDIEVEALYPSALSHLSVPEFMAASRAIDPSIGDRVRAAREQGQVLRYIAELEGDVRRVGLKALDADNPLANLKYISIWTDRYHDEPLTIVGKGAGLEVTAAGVLGDMISLGREVIPRK